MALSKSMADELSGRGRIRATAKLPEIDAYIRKVNKTSRPLSPTEVQVMRQEGAAQLRVIKMNWQVETGTSRAGWTQSVIGRMGQVAIVFENPVYYSGWIVRRGSHSVAALVPQAASCGLEGWQAASCGTPEKGDRQDPEGNRKATRAGRNKAPRRIAGRTGQAHGVFWFSR